MKKIFLSFVFCICSGIASAQWVVNLDEVQVVSTKEQHMVGHKIQTLDSLKLSKVSGATLTEAIHLYIPVYVKQDAGGLSTIRFRGTSPDHTAILFNGVNLNSLTLGHSNLSNISMFLFDDVRFQFGGASSFYGSDVIGGSILLDNKPEWNKGFRCSFQQDVGSFHHLFSGIKLAYSNKHIDYKIKAYRLKKENNFPFLNTLVKDFETNAFVMDTTRHSGIFNYGLLQELNFKISDRLISFANVWYENNFHEIQPNMSANYYGTSSDELLDRHLRLNVGLKYYKNTHKLNTGFSFVKNHQLYNNNTSQTIATNSLIFNTEYANSHVWNGDLQVGFTYQYIQPEVYAYSDNLEEYRIDVFSSYKKKVLSFLDISLNLRESFVEDYNSQFCPSAGVLYKIIHRKKMTFDAKLSAGKSYKIPTFNDRFWLPGGNPDILPESGKNIEVGLLLSQQKNKLSYKIDATVFLMDVDNWIQWVNQGDWVAKNIKKVENKGFEFNFESGYKFNSLWLLSGGLHYSYTSALEKESYQHTQTNSRQLQYTPQHMANAHIHLQYKKWTCLTSASYVGERYTEIYNILNDYLLINASVGRNVTFKTHAFNLSLFVNNMFDVVYQNQENYAMPGRNYKMSLKYFFN